MTDNTEAVREVFEKWDVSRAVVVERPGSVVTAAGDNVGRLNIEAETPMYGDFSYDRGSYDSLLGEMDWPASITWTTRMEGDRRDPAYPFDPPIRGVITNCGFGGRGDQTLTASRPEEVVSIHMGHLDVDKKARRMGYGQLMWDCYLAVVAFGPFEASGGIGSTEGGGTVRFLETQGVPRDDIQPGGETLEDGRGVTRWSTSAENVVDDSVVTVLD